MRNIKVVSIVIAVILVGACGGGRGILPESPDQQYRDAVGAVLNQVVSASSEYSDAVTNYADCTSTMLKCVQPSLDKVLAAAGAFDAIRPPERFADAHAHLKLCFAHTRNFVTYTEAGLKASDTALISKANAEIGLATQEMATATKLLKALQ